MTRERRLGRGLAALLGEPLDDSVGSGHRATSQRPGGPRLHEPAAQEMLDDHDAPVEADDQAADNGQMILLDVGQIDGNPFQPRRDFGESEIKSLAESLRQHDMLQPILVRRVGERWQLISGERRLRAAIEAGWTQVPVRVREADDRLVAELAIVENLQRKDLNPIEKALSFQRYLREHQCTQEELGRRLTIDRSTIANLLRLLELPELVQEALRNGTISAGHARALLPLGEERKQIDFCHRIRRETLSVRDIERLVQEAIQAEDAEPLTEPGGTTKRTPRTRSQQIATLEQELRVALGSRVEVRHSTAGKGRIVIHFHSHEEFERLRVQLTGEQPGEQSRRIG